MRKQQVTSNAMSHIGDLFAIYKRRLKPPQKTVEKAAATAITRISGIVVQPTDVTFTTSTRVLKINLPSIIKNEICLFQIEILETLHIELGTERTPLTLL